MTALDKTGRSIRARSSHHGDRQARLPPSAQVSTYNDLSSRSQDQPQNPTSNHQAHQLRQTSTHHPGPGHLHTLRKWRLPIRCPPGVRVFISYAHEDAGLAFAINDELEAHGVGVWIDENELQIGDSLIERVGDAIAEGDFVVAVVSPVSVGSPWCKKELGLAVTKGINERRIVVLPVRVGGAEMPGLLKDLVFADADTVDASAIAQRIVGAIWNRGAEDRHPDSRLQGAPPAPALDGVGRLLEKVDTLQKKGTELVIKLEEYQGSIGRNDKELQKEQLRLGDVLDSLPRQALAGFPLAAEVVTPTRTS